MRSPFSAGTYMMGAKRRINPETLMASSDSKGRALWDMPAPVKYAEHTKWRRHKKTGKRIGEPVQVPIYRGTSASFARYMRSQVRRNQRIAAEAMKAKEPISEEATDD